jgi:hypothetical protein
MFLSEFMSVICVNAIVRIVASAAFTYSLFRYDGLEINRSHCVMFLSEFMSVICVNAIVRIVASAAFTYSLFRYDCL